MNDTGNEKFKRFWVICDVVVAISSLVVGNSGIVIGFNAVITCLIILGLTMFFAFILRGKIANIACALLTIVAVVVLIVSLRDTSQIDVSDEQKTTTQASQNINIGSTDSPSPETSKTEPQSTELYRNTVLIEAQEQASAQNYTDAIKILSNALTVFPEDTIIRGKIEEYENEFKAYTKENALAEAAKFAADKNYIGAVGVLNMALTLCEKDSDLLERSNQYEGFYEADISDQIDKYLKNNEITAAKDLLETARTAFPSNPKISLMWLEIQSYESVSVGKLTPLNTSGSWNAPIVEIENALGTTFYDATNAFALYGSSYGEYYIDGKYTTVTGNLTSYYNMDQDDLARFLIWADSTLVYISPVITQKTKPFSFSIALPENTQCVKFVCEAERSCFAEILVTDLIFWNNPHYNEKYSSNGAVAVRSLMPINATGTWNDIPFVMENALGDSLYSTQSFFIPCDGSYGEYYIEGKYSRVTGNVTSYAYMEEGRECTLKILADDRVIYTSPAITQRTRQESFNVELPEGTQFVKFVCNANGYSNSEIFITDLLLWE